jgi:2-polyprenyl-6-hydroxyphenyl methylase/3-demethylubiquinone-9 3-methyltransferase
MGYFYRIHRVLKLISHYAPVGRTLEVGCAQGNISLLLAERGFAATAMDLQWEFLDYARRKWTHGDVSFITGSGDHLPLKGRSLDAVILTELLEHVAYPENFLRESYRVLKEHGVVILTTPNGDHRWNTLPTYRGVTGRKEALVPHQFLPDAEGHLFLFTMPELAELVQACGFRILHTEWFNFDFVTRVYWRLGPLWIWQGPGALLTRPLSRALMNVDRIMQNLSIIDKSRFARHLLLVAEAI